MDGISVLVAHDLRRRWRSWVALVLLVGLAGGLTTASFAGWRRTLGAMDRFVAAARPTDGYVSGRFDEAAVEALPEVEAASGGGYLLMVPVDAEGRPRADRLGAINPFTVDDERYGRDYERPIVVDGRLADPGEALEVVVDEALSATFGVGVGEQLTMVAYTPDQGEALFEQIGRLQPTGPHFDLDVVGIVRHPNDVVTGPDVPDVVYLGSRELYLTPAFDAQHRDVDVASIGGLFGDPSLTDLQVRLREGADPERFADGIRALDGDAEIELSTSDNLEAQRDAERAISLQASAVLGFGVLVALTGTLLASLAIRRQHESDLEARTTLRAIGLAPRAIVAVTVGKLALAAAAAAALAVGVAMAASPLAPLGFARRAVADPGVSVDVVALSFGAAATFLVVVLRGTVLALRAAGRAGVVRLVRPGVGPGDRAARMRLPAPVVAGVRAAWVQPGGRTVAATVLLAAVGVIGGVGFAASGAKLADDATLWGWTWDVVAGDGNDPGLIDRELEGVLADPDIADVGVLYGLDATELRRGDRSVTTAAVAIEVRRGTVEPRMLAGRPPRTDGEVALGASTAASLGVGVGDRLEVASGSGSVPFTVSGLAVFNPGLDAERIGEGSLFDPSAAGRLGQESAPGRLILGYAPGSDGEEVSARLRERFGQTVLHALPPNDVDQLERVSALPVAFSFLVAATALVTLAFTLALTVRRGRRDLAVLRTIGFVRSQLRSTVAVQATALVLPAAVLGAVLGLAAGRVAWSSVAEGLGAPVVAITPLSSLALVVVGALVLGNVIAAVPGRAAATTDPAAILRAE